MRGGVRVEGSLREVRGLLRLVILGLVCSVASGCGQALVESGSTPTVVVPDPTRTSGSATLTSASPTPASDEWASEVCAAAHSFLDSFTYGEPYGIASAGVTLEELKAHSAATTPSIIVAARKAAAALQAVPPRRPGADDFQRVLGGAFEDLAGVYESSGVAVEAASSRDEVESINAAMLASTQEVLRTLSQAREDLPPSTQMALADAPSCILLD